MWRCGKCSEQVEDDFAVCWKCGTSREGLTNPQFQAVPDAQQLNPGTVASSENPIACARCNTTLHYVGRKRFHEGTNWGVFGELGELFVKREHFDVYLCPRCGRVEFFVDGIGEQFRPQ
jgi:uncharacterized protein with PIN domain